MTYSLLNTTSMALAFLYPMAFAIATFLEKSLSKFERLFSFSTFCILLIVAGISDKASDGAAESGFVGLILFVSLIVSTLFMSLKMLKINNVEHHNPRNTGST